MFVVRYMSHVFIIFRFPPQDKLYNTHTVYHYYYYTVHERERYEYPLFYNEYMQHRSKLKKKKKKKMT